MRSPVPMLAFLALQFLFAVGKTNDCPEDKPCQLDDNPLHFSSDGYPQPYKYIYPGVSFAFTVDDGFAFGFQFSRFSLGKNDCLYFCPTSDISCARNSTFKKCGAEFDNGRPSHYYDQSNTVHVIFSPENSSTPYPGLAGRVLRLNKTTQEYSPCQEYVDLDKYVGYYYLTSDHFFGGYPEVTSAKKNAACVTSFATNRTNIRVAIYSFQSAETEAMTFSGSFSNGTAGTATLAGRNHIDPVAFYFRNQLDISYNFTAALNYSYYMYIATYNEGKAVSDCPNAGRNDMTKSDQAGFSASSTGVYLENTDCSWTFDNVPADTQLVLYVGGNTEKCCDRLGIVGTGWNFVGYHDTTMIYGNTGKDMTVRFQSDAIEQYVNAEGGVMRLNCSCRYDRNFHLNAGESLNLTSGIPYCSDMQCAWTVTSSRTTILSYSFIRHQLLSGDSVSVQNALMQPLSSKYDSTGSVLVNFTSLSKSMSYYTEPRDFFPGFTLQLTANKLNLERQQFDLCSTDFVDVNSDMLVEVLDAVVFRLSSEKCNAPIRAAYFAPPQGFSLDVYSGELDNGTPVNMSQYQSNVTTAFRHDPGVLTLRIVKLEKNATSFHMLFITGATTTVLGNSRPGAAYHNFSQGANKPYVIYQASADNSGLRGLSLQISNNLKFNMYKGASLDKSDLIAGDEVSNCQNKWISGAYPPFVFGHYVTVQMLNTTGEGTITWKSESKDSTTWHEEVGSDYPGLLVSPDYLTLPTTLPQSYSYYLEYVGAGHKKIEVQLLSPIPANANLTIVQYKYNDKLDTKSYTSASNFCSLSAAATSLRLYYNWQCGSAADCGKGLQLQYYAGDAFDTGSGVAVSLSTLLSIAVAFLHL